MSSNTLSGIEKKKKKKVFIRIERIEKLKGKYIDIKKKIKR
jgi:hypothetical protein